MKRMWPEEFNTILNGAEVVTLEASGAEDGSGAAPLQRKGLKVRIPLEQYEQIWPLAEMRFRLGDGAFASNVPSGAAMRDKPA